MGLGAEEVKAIMVDSEDTRGWYCSVAAALDEEEGGAKQGEGAEEACSVESLLSGHLHWDNWTATALSWQRLPEKAGLCSGLLPPPFLSS